MNVRSYVDLAYFICILHADASSVPAELQEAIGKGRAEDLERLFGSERHGTAAEYKKALWNMDTHLHETIHLWQALSYPFLYTYSCWAFRTVLKVFGELDVMFEDLENWTARCPGTLNLMTERVGVTALSALDLLESAASVVQWQLATRKEQPSALGFRRWTKRNPAYPEAVTELAKLTGDDELAVRLYLPLCHVAFETLNPVRAFVLGAHRYVALYGRTGGVSAGESKRRIERLVDEEAAREPQSRQRDISDQIESVEELPFYRFSMEEAMRITFGSHNWPHPTLFRLARRWRQESRERPELSRLLYAPLEVSSATVIHCFAKYQPLLFVRFGLPGRTRVVPLGRRDDLDYPSRVEREGPGIDGMHALLDLYVEFGAVRRATGAFYDDDTRLCPHRECPHFQLNYCNSWIFIPDTYQQCGFGEHMQYIRASFRRLKEAENE